MFTDISNLSAFQDTFRLDVVSFSQEEKKFLLGFLPRATPQKKFPVRPETFREVVKVVYEENEGAFVFRNEGEVFVSSVQDDLEIEGRKLGGLIVVGFDLNPDQFPNWASERKGLVRFRLVGGKECVFPFMWEK